MIYSTACSDIDELYSTSLARSVNTTDCLGIFTRRPRLIEEDSPMSGSQVNRLSTKIKSREKHLSFLIPPRPIGPPQLIPLDIRHFSGHVDISDACLFESSLEQFERLLE